MKKIVLIIGGLIFLINTIIGSIFSSYDDFNVILVDINILITIGLLYFLIDSKISDGFKIGLTVLFSITGLIRVLISFFFSENIKDNFSIIILLFLLALEIICLLVSRYLTEK